MKNCHPRALPPPVVSLSFFSPRTGLPLQNEGDALPAIARYSSDCAAGYKVNHSRKGRITVRLPVVRKKRWRGARHLHHP